jgi:hypothetical protein
VATEVAHLVARLTANTRDFNRGISQAETKMGKFTSVLKKGGLAAGVGLTTLGVVSVKNASNLEEQINKTTVVFRGSEKQILKWAKTTAGSFGISNRAALEAAGTFGNMLVPMGASRKEAAKTSMQFVELASDMASFNNASPEETLDALRAGLAGETEPLRRFGVFLNETRIKQVALNMGLYDGKGAIDAHAKALATQKIIMKDTADAQGDFARTSGSVANQQRIMKAEAEDLSAQLGKHLLPAVAKVFGVMNRFISWAAGVNGGARLKEMWGDVTDFTIRQWRRVEDTWDQVKLNFGKFTLWMERKAWEMLRDIVEPFSHLPGKMGQWARDAKETVNANLDKIETKIERLEAAAARAHNKRWKITFHTNADAVREKIARMRDWAERASGNRGVGDFGSFGMGATSLVALGRQLQSMGFNVGEHPQFGGVSPVHVPGSYHYQGRALDINYPGSAEPAKLDWLYSRLRSMPGVKELLWRTAGHYDHLHVAMDRGGVVPGRRGAPVPVLAHGGETFIPTHRAGVSAGNVYNFNGPVLNGDALLRYIQQQSRVSGRRGGPQLGFT